MLESHREAVENPVGVGALLRLSGTHRAQHPVLRGFWLSLQPSQWRLAGRTHSGPGSVSVRDLSWIQVPHKCMAMLMS